MKVYISSRSFTVDIGSFIIHHETGWYYCEDGKMYKNRSYSIPESFIKENELCFKYIGEFYVEPDYFIKPIFTQNDFDKLTNRLTFLNQ